VIILAQPHAWAQVADERSGPVPAAAARFALLWNELSPLWAAVPTIPAQISLGAGRIIESANGNFIADMGKTALVIGAMLLAGMLVRRRLQRDLSQEPGGVRLSLIVRRFLLECGATLGVLLLAVLLSRLLFYGPRTLSADLGAALIDLVMWFRLAVLVPKLLFRPGEPALRMIPASDQQVLAAQPWFMTALATGIGFPTLIPVWIAAGTAWEAAQALAIITGLLVAALGYQAAARFLGPGGPQLRRWQPAVAPFAAAFALNWAYGVVRLDFPFFFLVINLSIIAVTIVVVDRFLSVAIGLAHEQKNEAGSHYLFWRHYGSELRRCSYAVAAALVAVTISDWLVQVAPNVLGVGRLEMVNSALGSALAVFVIGYMITEFLLSWTRARFAPTQEVVLPGAEDSEGGAPASRLATILPIAHGFFAVLILAMATIAALSRLGVDTTPLLAGAGIFGLAISFGSQSLVRDIVAGIFYMADDAFRIGEYIEAGKLKGSVERISLRSVRMRHQNGHIHTVPFGQLGSVTNYSRDYLTVKFNLKLSRETDLETLRKTVKKIGLEMLDDPEIGKEFILPLKMQGVADVLENALLVRFKFTVRPGKPTYIQREAIKRMLNVFAEKGIRFASHVVTVQGSTGDDDMEDRESIRSAIGARSIQVPATG
jgi:small-conductance mechanosensitive channel